MGEVGVGFPRADLEEIKNGGLTIVPALEVGPKSAKTLDILTAAGEIYLVFLCL